MAFIEEVISWDNLNGWLLILEEAHETRDLKFKDALIKRVISSLRRAGAVPA